MKKVLLITLCAALWLPAVANPERKTVWSGGFEREYLIYIPQQVHDKPAGLIICLHGFNGSMQDFFNVYAISGIADSLNYMIVAPQALPEQEQSVINLAGLLSLLSGDRIQLNAVWGCGLKVLDTLLGITLLDEELNRNVDDVEFIRLLIEQVSAEYALPEGNVFLLGTSMGGYMSYQYALKQPLKPAGLISIVGSMGLNVKGMGEGLRVPVCDFHSLTDEVVPYTGCLGSNGNLICLAQPKADVLRYWAETNGAGDPVTEMINYYPSTNGITVKKTIWPHPQYEVIHYQINGSGHSYFFRKENGDCMDYPEEIGKFISAHTLSGPSAIAAVPPRSLRLYPNPAQNTLYLTSRQNGRATICNITGKVVCSQSLFDAEQIDVSSLTPGVYFLHIQAEKEVVTGKFIKK